jgi:ribosomal protein S6
MPCYQLVLFARPDITPEKLATLFRSVARVVYRERGQFRTIENLGVRPVAWPVRQHDLRFDEVRWVHALYDCAPTSLAAVGQAIQAEKAVLQYKHLKYEGVLGKFTPIKRDRLKRHAGAMRLNKVIFDPVTMGTKLSVASDLK